MKIYIADVTLPEIAYMEGLVSKARIDRSKKYKFEIDRRRSLGVEALLNYAVRSTYPSVPIPVRLMADEHKKPHLIGEHIEFSLSHSGNYAACVIADVPVGIDIERHRSDNQGVARRFFTRRECADITDDERFYTYWTLKESFVKAVGQGLSLPMNSFEVMLGKAGEPVAYTQHINEENYFGMTYSIEQGYSLAVCARGIKELPAEIEVAAL
ncbi:MAG TPA: 4'-phosphopantetheinyl transferase superfamily protein [Lachnospiraceae bacterium]|nr:4'-phosphopantetheinyl transferase superfamily protein [Lachnospiraceae bacterium]